MKNIFRITVFLGAALLFISKVNAQQTRSLPDYTSIKAGDAFSIELIKADRHSIYMEEDEEKDIKAEVNNGTLELSTLKKITRAVKIKLYFRELKDLELHEAAQAHSNDT